MGQEISFHELLYGLKCDLGGMRNHAALRQPAARGKRKENSPNKTPKTAENKAIQGALLAPIQEIDPLPPRLSVLRFNLSFLHYLKSPILCC